MYSEGKRRRAQPHLLSFFKREICITVLGIFPTMAKHQGINTISQYI